MRAGFRLDLDLFLAILVVVFGLLFFECFAFFFFFGVRSGCFSL